MSIINVYTITTFIVYVRCFLSRLGQQLGGDQNHSVPFFVTVRFANFSM